MELLPSTALIGIGAFEISASIVSVYCCSSFSCRLEYQYLVFSLSIILSKVRYGRHTFSNPSTSPILTLSVTRAIISVGDIICANCEFVSIRSNRGSNSHTFSHGSTKRSTATLNIRSMISNSISEKSLGLSRGTPFPPNILSTTTYPRFCAISMTMLPFNGDAFTIPSNTGFDNAFENSEYVTASEFITST